MCKTCLGKILNVTFVMCAVILYAGMPVKGADLIGEDIVIDCAEVEDTAISIDSEETFNISEDIDISDQILQAGGLIKSEDVGEYNRISRYTSPDTGTYSEAYEDINSAVMAWDGMSSEIEVDVSSYMIPVGQHKRFVTTAVNLHPEWFILNSAYKYTYDSSGYVRHILFYVDTTYSKEDFDKFNNAVNSILALVDPSWTGLQKIIYVHDYLVTHVDYDTDLEKYDAYDAIVGGNAVCQGYALAFQYLLNRIDPDYDCRLVTSESLKHAWNVVSLGGYNYYIDTTWDDPTDMYSLYDSYGNFMVSQDKLHSSHASTDWLNVYGDAIYGQLNTPDTFDSAPWMDMHSSMPMFENVGFYYRGYSPVKLYKYDFDSGESTELASYSDVWRVWGKTSIWTACYAALLRYDNNIYMTLPQRILAIDQDGNTVKEYHVPQQNGYVYGACISDGFIKYDVYTSPHPSKGEYIGRYTLEIDVSGRKKGDVTGDGVVAMGDVVKVARAVAGNIILTEDEKKAADVTGDNVIAMGDVVKIARYVAGSVKEL